MGKKLNIEEFIKRAIKTHGNKYDYSLVFEVGSRNNISIICPIHGIFEQRVFSHLNGSGCKKCADENNKITKVEFIKKSNNIHKHKFDYSKVVYVSMHEKVIIICPIHGEFEQLPFNHYKNDCPYCNIEQQRIGKEEFDKKSKEIHGNKYDYSSVIYIKNTKNVTIICPVHGKFEQTPKNHIQKKCGCPYCNESHGERSISLFLDKMNIIYDRQKKFDKCKNKRCLPFDFYLQDYNLCIEFDGEQHFKINEKWGGKESFDRTLRHDEIKNKFCIDNNIKLIRIKYNENIEDKLKEIWVKN